MVIEKALDGHSRGAVAQQDIEKFYDSIRSLRVARWLVNNGASVSLAASALRHQMLPQVTLSAGGVKFPMNNRSRGSITGSRVAGALGRVPVESTIRDKHVAWKRSGFSTTDRTLMVAAYVDNIYSAGASLDDAINILEDFAQHLQSTWGLNIKPSSRSCMTARGCHEVPVDAERWQLCSEFHVLGHILQDNGSTNACWTNTSKNMWKAYFANCKSQTARSLPLESRLPLISRAVLPVMQHRDTRWPPTREREAQIDRLQRKMVSSVMRLPFLEHEPPVDYLRRRHREATKVMRRVGFWSNQHCKRVQAWHEHLQRPRNHRSWAASLLNFRDHQWLQQQRLQNSSANESRTRTRASVGFVATRWYDGVLYAKQRAPQA